MLGSTSPKTRSKLLERSEWSKANPDTREPTDDKKTSTPAGKVADHKNEGFLKSTWHKLTHQHDHLEPETPEKEAKTGQQEEDETKKASGSG